MFCGEKVGRRVALWAEFMLCLSTVCLTGKPDRMPDAASWPCRSRLEAVMPVVVAVSRNLEHGALALAAG